MALAYAVLDAQLTETKNIDFKGKSQDLLECLGFGEDYQRLRLYRNRIIYLRPDEPVITVDQQWGERSELEKEAGNAVMLRVASKNHAFQLR